MKKVLITLGCSMTEGFGCYDESLLGDGEILEDGKFNLNNQEPSFHKNGWPNRVGKKIGYDEVINLGLAGSGNGYSIRTFMDIIDYKSFKDCEVSVIWLLAEPSRLDTYYENNLTIIGTPHDKKGQWMQQYFESKFSSENFFEDCLLETNFYIKTLKEVCDSRNWNCLIINYLNTSMPNKKYDWYIEDKGLESDLNNETDISNICRHPNESGYEKISNKIVSYINWDTYEYNENITWQHKKWKREDVISVVS